MEHTTLLPPPPEEPARPGGCGCRVSVAALCLADDRRLTGGLRRKPPSMPGPGGGGHWPVRRAMPKRIRRQQASSLPAQWEYNCNVGWAKPVWSTWRFDFGWNTGVHVFRCKDWRCLCYHRRSPTIDLTAACLLGFWGSGTSSKPRSATQGCQLGGASGCRDHQLDARSTAVSSARPVMWRRRHATFE